MIRKCSITTRNLLILFISFYYCTAELQAQKDLGLSTEPNVIFTLRGGNLLDKVSLDEMKELDAVNKIFSELTRAANQADKQIDELGIDLNKDAHFMVSLAEDNSIYMGTVFEVNDKDMFQQIFMNPQNMEEENGNLMSFSNGYTTSLIGGKGVISYTVITPSYEDPYGYDNYLLEEPAYQYEYEDEYMYDDAVEVPPAPEMEEPIEEIYEEEIEIVEEEIEVVEEEVEIPSSYDDYIYEQEQLAMEQERKAMEEEKKELELKSKLYATSVIPIANSLSLTTKNVDQTADFSVHVQGYDRIMKYFMNNPYSYYRSAAEIQMENMLTDMYADFEWITMNGYYDKEELRITSDTKLAGGMAEWYGNMLNAEMNSEMLKYIPYDDHLMFMSGALDSEEMLNGYYNYMKGVTKHFPQEDGMDVGEMASIFIDFTDMFLDEEAIGNLIKGDFYAGITDINSYEVEYTSYEYDDNYEWTEVTKTKQEVRPDFLIMFSSDDMKNINNIFKLINITSKDEFKNEGDYYKLSAGKSVPLDIYAMQKDGLVFIYSSQGLFDFIKKGGNKPTAKQKSSVSDYSTKVFINGKKLANKVPLEDLPSDAKSMVTYMRDNLGVMTMEQGKMDGQILKTKMTMSAEGGHKNSFAYFLNFINDMATLDKQNNSYRN